MFLEEELIHSSNFNQKFYLKFNITLFPSYISPLLSPPLLQLIISLLNVTLQIIMYKITRIIRRQLSILHNHIKKQTLRVMWRVCDAVASTVSAAFVETTVEIWTRGLFDCFVIEAWDDGESRNTADGVASYVCWGLLVSVCCEKEGMREGRWSMGGNTYSLQVVEG
jgi:hypothetical protein